MKQYMIIKIHSILTGFKIQLVSLIKWTAISSMLSPFIYYIMYIFGYTKNVLTYDYEMLFAVFILVSIDTLVGIKKWIFLKKFNDKKVAVGAFEKMFLCYCVMVIFNLYTMRLDSHPDLQSYMKLFGFLIVISYPSGSIFKNIFFLSKGQFPPIGFMRKWENYENTASVEEIFKKEAEKGGTIFGENTTNENTTNETTT